MRVLVAHNRYRSNVPSGENRVVDTEIAALESAGVQVVPYLRSSDEIDAMSMLQRLTVPAMPVHSRRAMGEISTLIRTHRPDILHLHNPYPLISLSVVRVAHAHGLPIVQTVHNHRHSCIRGSYFRGGHPCQLCRGKEFPWPAIRHGCYRDSYVQSVPMAVAFRAHRPDQRAVDRYIALNPSVADSILASGLVRPEQVVVRANSVPDPGPPTQPGIGLLFVGRLTAEKGVPLLLAAWRRAKPSYSLTVVGDGPLRPLVEEFAADPHSNVVVRGQLTPDEVASLLRGCAAVVLPSTSPEGLPLAILEAFAHGRPVVATAVDGLADAVDPEVGLLTTPTREALAAALTRLPTVDLPALGAAARHRYEQRYATDVVIRSQIEIYRAVLAERAR